MVKDSCKKTDNCSVKHLIQSTFESIYNITCTAVPGQPKTARKQTTVAQWNTQFSLLSCQFTISHATAASGQPKSSWRWYWNRVQSRLGTYKRKGERTAQGWGQWGHILNSLDTLLGMNGLLPPSSAFPSYISGADHFGRDFWVCNCFIIQPLRKSHSVFADGAYWVCFCCVRSFESVRWNAWVHWPHLSLYSHKKEF